MSILLKTFKQNNIPITWKTIFVGRKLKLADNFLIEDFATDYLAEHYPLNNINIIELAYGVKDNFELDDILKKLTEDFKFELHEDTHDWDLEKRKWRFIKLKELHEKNFNDKKLLEEIESIYCDFDHEENLSPFITYMAPDIEEDYDYRKHTKEENFRRMIQKFENFLIAEQLKLST